MLRKNLIPKNKTNLHKVCVSFSFIFDVGINHSKKDIPYPLKILNKEAGAIPNPQKA